MVGRHYVQFLKEQGWDVFGLDIKNDPDEDAFQYFVTDYDEHFDLLVHCAYEVGGRAHIDGRNTALIKNVAMDSAMFNWALQGGAAAVLYFSSSAAYPRHLQNRTGDRKSFPDLYENLIDLNAPDAPDANYGWAKLTGEKLAEQAAGQGLRVHTLRPFSGYSPDQDLTYPFPAILKRAVHGDLTVWGPAGQTRDWIHIDDVVKGSFAVYQNDDRRPVNLCTGVGTTFGELVHMMYDAAGKPYGDRPAIHLVDKPTGVYCRVGDPERMNEHYVAQISIEEGVRYAVAQAR